MSFHTLRRVRKQKQLPYIALLLTATFVVFWGMNSSLRSTEADQPIQHVVDVETTSLPSEVYQQPQLEVNSNSNSPPVQQDAAIVLPNVLQALDPQLPPHIQNVPPGVKIYKFFDMGSVYHDMNFTCPVPWYWIYNPEEADVIWHNVLEYRIIPAMNQSMTPRYFPEQKYAFMSLESGVYYPFIYERKNDGYDYVVDYRIWPDHPHGPADIPAVYLTNPTAPDFTLDFRKPPNLKEKRKDAIMAAFISNCGSINNRLQILDRLIELIPVHSYGKCSHNYDQPVDATGNWAESKSAIAQHYYFLYTPENSEDMSYVTEKVYDAFRANAVPIYMGAPDIDRFIPHPDSIIRISDFESTEELADYLKELVADPKKYEKHVAWKKKEFSPEFKRVLRLASRTVQCRLAMTLEGMDFEADLQDLEIFPPNE